jgi:hypothetical protein
MLNFAFAPRNFAFQQRDALVELVHRKRVEVLLPELRGEVVLATRQIFVGVHAVNVDPGRSDVNKTSGFYRGRKATNR